MAEFNFYKIYCYSAPQYDWDVRIDLFMNATAAGTLFFMKTGQSIPLNTNSGGIPKLYYSVSQFPAIMSVLREEKPLFITLNAANGIGTVSTDKEPVGEQEGV
jgi:hypothetical protein